MENKVPPTLKIILRGPISQNGADGPCMHAGAVLASNTPNGEPYRRRSSKRRFLFLGGFFSSNM
jgi:hypothetical protein